MQRLSGDPEASVDDVQALIDALPLHHNDAGAIEQLSSVTAIERPNSLYDPLRFYRKMSLFLRGLRQQKKKVARQLWRRPSTLQYLLLHCQIWQYRAKFAKFWENDFQIYGNI